MGNVSLAIPRGLAATSCPRLRLTVWNGQPQNLADKTLECNSGALAA
jgi:hypothetical protein